MMQGHSHVPQHQHQQPFVQAAMDGVEQIGRCLAGVQQIGQRQYAQPDRLDACG